jgi:1-acyl-sn-glycerol-3-phosphate acyltransferase
LAYRRGAEIVGFTPSFFPFFAMFQLIMLPVRLVNWLLYRTRVAGRANLGKASAAILVSNHTMLMDPAIIAHALGRRRTYFTMLEETALIPYLGTFVRLLGALPIPEGPGSLLFLENAARRALSELSFLHFFPEGECYRWNQEIQPFQPGAFLLACRLGLPVIPITTVLRDRRWRGRTSVRVFGRTVPLPPVVTVIIGSPVHSSVAFPDSYDLHALRGAALHLASLVRASMQATIDTMGGSKTIYRGKMPRLVKKPRADAAQTAVRRTG